MLCDDLWGGLGLRWEGGFGGGNLCILRADSLHCRAETNNMVKQLHSIKIIMKQNNKAIIKHLQKINKIPI